MSYGPELMSRLRAETMPAVTEPPRLNGLPIAITHSPSRTLSESPNFTAFSGFVGLTFSTARSVLVSRPTSSAFSLVPSLRMTVISSASAMTWLLVTTMPDGIDDEAGAERIDAARRAVRRLIVAALAAAVLEELLEEFLERRARRQLRHLLAPPPRDDDRCTVCEVEMLTTASITFSATSAMSSGPRASDGVGERGQHERRSGDRGQRRLADDVRKAGEQAGHGRQIS